MIAAKINTEEAPLFISSATANFFFRKKCISQEDCVK